MTRIQHGPFCPACGQHLRLRATLAEVYGLNEELRRCDNPRCRKSYVVVHELIEVRPHDIRIAVDRTKTAVGLQEAPA
jgi:hypothetical protein